MEIFRHYLNRTSAWSAVLLFVPLSLSLASAAFGAVNDSLGPGDTVRITVFQNPDLETETRISTNGTIVFPLIGPVNLADRTVAEAGEVIASALRSGNFVRNPQVSVFLVEIRSRRVSVLGHVENPGQYPLDGTGLTLTDMLALAGGISETGDNTVILMTKRTGEPQRLEIDVSAMFRNGDLSGNVGLESGDTVFVPSAPVFYVYGAVQRAGAYRLEPDTRLHNALSLGGGLTPRGSERGLKIHRRMPDGTVRKFNADLADPLQPDDVVYVRESLF